MKKATLVLCIVLTAMTSSVALGQMAAATKITWDISINTDVDASKGVIWKLLNDTDKLPKYSDGYVTSIHEMDGDTREVVFADGSKRKETQAQTDHMNKFLVLKMAPESLPEGIQHAEIAIFTKDIDDDHSSISWKAKIDGKKAAKKAYKEKLTAEIESYVKGLKTFQK